MTYRVSIVLCTFNRAETLAKTLDDLSALSGIQDIRCELIIVDNRSTDQTGTVIREFISKTSLDVVNLFEERQGKSHALNQAISCARGRYILFTDDDVRIDKDWMVNMIDALDQLKCMAVGGRIFPVWEIDKPAWYSESGEYGLMAAIVTFDRGDVRCRLSEPLFGANMGVCREAFDQYGHFRADLGPMGAKVTRGEDSEFVERLLAAEETVFYVPDAVVHHPVEVERATRSYFRKFYFDDGRVEIRTSPPQPNGWRLLGVPRYLIRALMVSSVKWLSTLDGRQRFFFQLQCCRIAGSIFEILKK